MSRSCDATNLNLSPLCNILSENNDKEVSAWLGWAGLGWAGLDRPHSCKYDGQQGAWVVSLLPAAQLAV